MRLSSAGRGVKHEEVVVHVLVNLHDTGLVRAAVAVIGRREYSDDMLIMTPVEAVHDELMRTRDQLQAIDVIELLRNILAEGVPSTSGGDTPACAVIGI